MKKYLKTQAKKSISFMLALLMVLSCWVWIAPTKAEAANAENGEYAARIRVDIPDNGECTGMTVTVYYKNSAGTQLSVGLTPSIDTMKTSGTNMIVATGDVPGFPIGFDLAFTIDGCGDRGQGTYNNFDLQIQDTNGQWHTLNNSTNLKWTDAEDDKSVTYAANPDMCATLEGMYPVATSMKDVAATTVAVPKLGSGVKNTTTTVTIPVYDQYGVRMLTTTPERYYVEVDGSEYKGAGTTVNFSNGSASVTVNENLQKDVLAGSDGKNVINLVAALGSVTPARQTINLTYPSYITTFDSNGRTGSTPNAVIKMNKDGDQSGTWSTTGYYGLTIPVYPTGVVTKKGYTFKGFWTNQQPASGDAGINALEADFATPVSTDDYNKHAAKEGATVSNGIVTLATGEKYCDGGAQWNPDKNTVGGDTTYYGWWVSTDITAKFYDIDGSYLGTKTYKYGQTGSQVTWPDPTEEYDAGAYEYKTFANKWMDIDGEIINEASYVFGTDDKLELVLTPTYTTKTYKATYTVNFINPTSGTNLTGSGDYAYRYILGSEIPATVTLPNALANAADYSYEFAGWTDQVPSNNRYHIIAEDNTTFAFNNDWVVREDATYYPVFRSTVRKYVVQFNYIDSTGVKVSKVEHIAYGASISTPDYVNTTYAAGGMGYELQGWKYTNAASAQVILATDGILAFNSANVLIAMNNRADGVDESAIVFEAAYDNGTPMPYNVTFKYKDAEGKDAIISAQVYNEAYITQETVDLLDIPAEYDDGTALYTFSGNWKVTEGLSDKDEYTKDEFTSFSPKSHTTFEAVYGDGVPFYTVTYVDGAATQSYRVLQGLNVPAWTYTTTDEDGNENVIEYVPKDSESETGTYKFAGWYDEEQTDSTYETTNGTEYTTESIVSGDVTLYAQYVFEPFKFTIKFMDYTGTVQLAAGEFEYGQHFDDIFFTANKAAQYRAPDETYSYTFIGWDQPYNEDALICEGKDVTFIAQYKPSYIYYDATWYNSLADMNNKTPIIDETTGKEIGTEGLLATTHHTYDSRLYAPSVKTTAPSDAPAGKSYVFAGWYYKDANGEAQAYVRGMSITADMEFYATYSLVTEAHTVTTVVAGEETEYQVADGAIAKAVPTPGNTYVDATTHQNFAGWYTDESYTTAFDIDTTPITDSITIYAKFDVENHSKTNKELVSEPTYYVTGSEKIWCSCDREQTEETVEIAMLTDGIAPTGTIYLGTQGKWSSTDEVGAAATDGEDVKYYANANTDIILTINDTGDINTAYNPSGTGKGIAKIQGFISNAVYTQGNQTGASSEIVTIFEDSSEELNNTANYVIKLGQYEGLVEGETYIAYYYVLDKAGNVLNTKVRTAKFIYDNTAPVFAIEGVGNADKVAAGTPTYCAAATVTEIEENATLTVNGTVVTVTNGEYVIEDAGNYIITVTDRAGNSTSKKIVVTEGHTTVTTEQKVTCETDGYLKETCIICDEVVTNTVTKSEGHKWVDGEPVKATCTENAATVKTCSVCGEKEVTETPDSALNHSYAEDTDGNIIYTVVTKATCKAVGKKIANCERCGGATLTAEIPVDTENGHVYGGIKTLKATCTEDGKYYQTCKYCFATKDGETIAKTGHKETYKVVTTAATCGATGVETEKCKKCEAVIGTAEIPATGKHIVYEVETKAPTATEKGYIKYGCKTCDWTKTEDIDTLKLYTVTFVNEDGSTIVELKDKVVGTTITADDVTEPTKDSDNTYKYTFAGWEDANGNAVKLPFDVSADITLKATFKETTIIYTHKFMVPTKWTITLDTESDSNIQYAELMGAYNDTNKVPVGVPTFTDADADTDAELKKLYTFKFLGWSTTGAEGDIVTDFTMKGDATFYAVFEAEPVKYDVIFYNYKGSNFLWNTTVNGGEYVTYGGVDPKYNADETYHYVFAGWLQGNRVVAGSAENYKIEMGPITATTRYIADFTAVEHEFVIVEKDADGNVVTWDATCTKEGQKTEVCACGYEKKTTIPMVDHDYELQADGSKKCKVCGDIVEPEAMIVTITFVNDDGDVLKTAGVAEGKTYTYTAPAKASTVDKDFTFANWTDADGNEVAKTAEITVTAGAEGATYTANYQSVTRKYRVTYFDWDHTPLKTEVLEYGADIPGAPAAPERAYDRDNHYTFAGWNVVLGTTETGKVAGTVEIYATYTATAHTMDKTITTEATCTTPSSTSKACECGYAEVKSTNGVTLAHQPDENGVVVDVEAGLGVEGKQHFTCTYCKENIEQTIPAIPSDTIRVTVYDNDGNLAKEGAARVQLIDKNTDKVYAEKSTDKNGVAVFVVPKGGSWRVAITGNNIEGGNYGDVTPGDNTFGKESEQEPVDTGCSCTCHKNTFWAWFFRLFQKLIKLITGTPRCCAYPDSRI